MSQDSSEIEVLEQALAHAEKLSTTLMDEQAMILARLDPLITRFHAASLEWRKVEEFLLRTRELIEVRIERAQQELRNPQNQHVPNNVAQ